MTMFKRPCKKAGCGETQRKAWCDDHEPEREERDRKRYPQHKDIYNSKRWRHVRKQQLRLEPMCENKYCNDTATEVDHVEGLTEGGDPYDPDNLQSLCKRCHSTKTAREVSARARS